MTLPAWTLKFAAAAAIPALVGAGTALSAPSPATGGTDLAIDETYEPGAFGVALAAVTGPRGSGEGRVPACADPARRGDLRPCLK